MEREITITVTDEEARRTEERVAAGRFESAADYVHSALSTTLAHHTLEIPDDVLFALLEQDDADENPGVPADEAFAQVRGNLETKYGKS